MNSNLYPCASPHSTCTLPLYLTLHPCLIAHTSISHPTPYSPHPCTSFHTPTPYPTSLYLAPLHMYLNTHSCISPCTSPPTPTTSPHWILHGSWGDSALNQLSCSSPKLGSAEVKQARLTLKNHQFRTVESGSKGISSHSHLSKSWKICEVLCLFYSGLLLPTSTSTSGNCLGVPKPHPLPGKVGWRLVGLPFRSRKWTYSFHSSVSFLSVKTCLGHPSQQTPNNDTQVPAL